MDSIDEFQSPLLTVESSSKQASLKKTIPRKAKTPTRVSRNRFEPNLFEDSPLIVDFSVSK